MKTKIIFIIILFSLISGGFFYFQKKSKERTLVINQPVTENQTSNTETEATKSDSSTTDTESNATKGVEQPKSDTSAANYDKFLIAMPFTTQAPGGNWDALHEDACEEASLIMVNHYMTKKSIANSLDADPEIKSMISYEETLPYGTSITLNQLNEVAKNYLSMKTGRIVTDVSAENIKSEIRKGHPVIIPAAGKLLANPNFRNGGPNYHMLVIKGYDQKNFITNDPGTRKGEGFTYSYDNLITAIHDWNADNILNGQKAYLVFD